MFKRRYQYVVSKWTKTQLLMENESIRPYMPHTELLTKQILLDMLSAYPVVYLKPDSGMKGRGIIRITQYDEHFIVHTKDRIEKVDTPEQLIRLLLPLVKGYKYLIQQGIFLLSHEGQPIDFRVLMQMPKDEWVYSGIVGKLGEKNSITTNFANGGKAIPFRTTLEQTLNLSIDEIKAKRDELVILSFSIANELTASYPGLRELGIDYAIDHDGQIWIIEVNTTPGHQLFRFLPNEKIYQRIIRNCRLINGSS